MCYAAANVTTRQTGQMDFLSSPLFARPTPSPDATSAPNENTLRRQMPAVVCSTIAASLTAPLPAPNAQSAKTPPRGAALGCTIENPFTLHRPLIPPPSLFTLHYRWSRRPFLPQPASVCRFAWSWPRKKELQAVCWPRVWFGQRFFPLCIIDCFGIC